ncbi:hypothetical protein EDB80DRAFT_881767 [Ilyonectria destructans]|nr:hypothetical protein EDB80DRAFT_881767 [Ilyonectria destructans]
MARQFNNVAEDSWLGFLSFDNTTNAGAVSSSLPTILESNQGQGQALRGQAGDEQDTITRLIKIETMLKWIYDNQIKLLEKYISIEQRMETMKKSLDEQGECIKDSLDQLLTNGGSMGCGTEDIP